MSHAHVAVAPRPMSRGLDGGKLDNRGAERRRDLESGDGFQQFLNPASMLTPGIAGALTMMITNALVQQFPVEPGYAGLGVSFLFGTLVLSSKGRWWVRCVYYILNSLIIFCVAMGANHAGVAADSVKAEPELASAHAGASEPEPVMPVPPMATPSPDARFRGGSLVADPATRQLIAEKQALEQESQRLRQELAKLKAAQEAAKANGQADNRHFFKPWFQQPVP
jgi:hypothetical protein